MNNTTMADSNFLDYVVENSYYTLGLEISDRSFNDLDSEVASSVNAYLQIAYGVSLFLCAVGVLENSISLVALFQMAKPRQSLHILLIYLAVSDLVFATISLIYTTSVQMVHGADVSSDPASASHDHNSTLVCVSWILADLCWFSFQFPLFATTYIVLYQVITLAFPLRSNAILTKKLVHVAFGVTLVVASVFLVAFHLASFSNGGSDCSSHYTELNKTGIAWYYAVLCTVMVILNVLLYVGLFRLARKIVKEHEARAQHRGGELQENDDRAATKSTKLVVTVVILSASVVTCWLPAVVTFYMKAYAVAMNYHVAIDLILMQVVTGIVPLLNAIIDPIIYGVRLPEVREGYRRLFGKFKKARYEKNTCSRRATEETTM